MVRGKTKGVPGIFSQGETLEELEANIKDANSLMVEDEPPAEHPGSKTKGISVDVA